MEQLKGNSKFLLTSIILSLIFASQIFEIKGDISSPFATIVIEDQIDALVKFNGELTISPEMLSITYSGDYSKLQLEVQPGEGYSFTGQTIFPNILYNENWEAKGKEIFVNIQVSDGVDLSEVYPFKVLVIPPILPLAYSENSCKGIISLTLSAYKPNQRHEESFPFTFKLIDDIGDTLKVVTINNAAPFQSSATATFGQDFELNRDIEYKIYAVDNLGREYLRNAGPLGVAYSLDFELNFAGLLCPEDKTGIVEFIIFNATLPVNNFIIIDSNGKEKPTDFEIVSEADGFVVIQTKEMDPGTYTLEIEDRFQCNGRESFEIVIPEPVETVETVNHVTCYGDNNGEVSLLINGGWSSPFPGSHRKEWIQYDVTWYDDAGNEMSDVVNSFVTLGGQIIGMESKLQNLPPGEYFAKIIDEGRLFEISGAAPLVCENSTAWITIEGPEPLTLTETTQNISCNGVADGSITVNPAGGTPEYKIEWYAGNFENPNSPVSGELLALPANSSGDEYSKQQLTPGEYAVLITDQNGCIIAKNFTITEPTPLTLVELSDLRKDVRCFGEATGSIAIELYKDTPTPFSIEVFKDGELLNVMGPVNSITSNTLYFSNLKGGLYDFRIVSSTGCDFLLEGILVAQPETGLLIQDTIISEYNGYQISFPGANDGNISLDINGGQGTYDYYWTGPNGFEATTKDINNLGPGEYQFIVTDENYCTASLASVILNAPEPLTLTPNIPEVNGFQISCFGYAGGEIKPNPSGGTGNYSFKWTGPEGFSSIESNLQNLSAGFYSLEVADENGALVEATYKITEPNELILSEAIDLQVPVACYGESNGAFTINIDQASIAPFTLSLGLMGTNQTIRTISDFTSDAFTFENLSGNQYWVTVEDANGCIKRLDDILVDQPETGLQLTDIELSGYNGYEISCAGAFDGSILFNVSGNQGPLSYSWTGPNGFTSNEPNLDGLASGNYEVLVLDENGCTLSSNFDINEPSPLVLLDEVSDYNGFGVHCNGGNEGFIYLDITGGSGTTKIEWSGPDGFISEASRLEDIFPGTYHVSITDTNGCEINKTYTLTEPQGLEIAELSDEKVNVSCYGQETGVLAAVINRTSAGPYRYELRNEANELINASPPTNETNWFFTDLPAEKYSITIIDANNCFKEINNLEITQPLTGLQIDEVSISSFNKFNISCFEAADGWIDITTSGGSGNNLYKWSGPDNFSADTPSIKNLIPGDYHLTVVDQNGCEVLTEIISLIEPEPLLINSEMGISNGYGISCNGANDGYIELSPSGGTDVHTIDWTGPKGFTSDALSLNNLSPGIYTVNVGDENGCEVSEQFTITEPAPLSITLVEKTDILCYGEATGSISLLLEGGIINTYSYDWTKDGVPIALNSPKPEGLSSGTYEVTVTDANGCQINSAPIVIKQPTAPLEVVMEQTEVSCYNANDANLSIAIKGGVKPYQISWNIGATQSSFEGIGPGFYQVTVTDANGCKIIKVTTIEEVPVFKIDPVINPISCFGETDASILLNLDGGKAPVTATWAHGPEQSSIYNLGPGVYTVYLEDGSGCTIERTFNLLEPELLVAVGHVQNASSCFNGQSGEISLTVSGGRPPYSYNWSNGKSSPSISNLTNGSYSVEVTDQSGCFVSQTFEVSRPDPISINLTNTTTAQCSPRKIIENYSLNIDGGVAPYTIAWSSGEVFEEGYRMEANAPGNYQVTVTDASGCIQTKSFAVQNNIILVKGDYLSDAFPLYGENLVNFDVQFTNKSNGNIGLYYWDFGDGNNSLETNPTYRYKIPGTYTVTLTVTDIWGCETSTSFPIKITDFFLKTPNVFSPNGDGLNDYFFPKFLNINSLVIIIMNTWGEILYQSADLEDPGWDGTFRGQKASPGNYVYKLNYTTADGRNFSDTGAFMLLE
ncbi:PKD domain-containing protein [Cyclobacterium qasimii]|uniref:PKD domain-containing protein n=1 Tax=Cyclobacterium qasimii TaxID=1350429 RepID=UPI001F377BBF|nr:PKD domain-containing protein [Cyclobacterium qasimii]